MRVRLVMPVIAMASALHGAVIAAPQSKTEPVARPALSGQWILTDANAGGGKIADQVEIVAGAAIVGAGATDGAGTGGPGGRGGFIPAVTDMGNGRIPMGWSIGDVLPGTKPKRLSAAEALKKELTTPPEELTLTLGVDTITIGDGIGAPVLFKINGKSESHQLVNGSVKTKTFRVGQTLRQDIDAGRNADFARTFELSDDGQTMRVSVGSQASASDWQFGTGATGTGAPDRNAAPRRSLYRRVTSR